MKIFCVLFFALLCVFPLATSAENQPADSAVNDPARIAAARELVAALELKKDMGVVISAETPEAVKQIWNTWEDVHARAYAETYTTAELRQITAMLKTPAGRLWVERKKQVQEKQRIGLARFSGTPGAPAAADNPGAAQAALVISVNTSVSAGTTIYDLNGRVFTVGKDGVAKFLQSNDTLVSVLRKYTTADPKVKLVIRVEENAGRSQLFEIYDWAAQAGIANVSLDVLQKPRPSQTPAEPADVRR
ncbi:MAG: DUF2059 domain-containing protein [Puniceicoccales bacterium]|jgi:hypothetical protein|nr:DUF2059 domain-containing protein [Puniceicoccales bacterium]